MEKMNMVKYTLAMINCAKDLFPTATLLHKMMREGDTKALDVVQSYIGLKLDEDDIVRAFRNKKEYKILEIAQRAQDIRKLYCEMYMLIEKQNTRRAELNKYDECL
jgi:hypothetical protein